MKSALAPALAMRGVLLTALIVCGALGAEAAQTINSTSPTSCVSNSGTLGTINFITDFDNGTFGSESGAPDQSPSVNPYPSMVSGGNYRQFYAIGHGDYSYVANPVTPRNTFHHAGITDPEYGATGRFFASDPNADTPTLNFNITNVIPNQNYEVAFWAANSEPNGTPNRVNAVVDGITSYSTGPLPAINAALQWQRHAFVFNAGNRTVISLAMASTETGSGGRDFYLDNVTLRQCTVAGGSITGQIYVDANKNNIWNPGVDSAIPSITVQLWDTRGTAATGDDVFVSTTDSDGTGQYSFSNIAPSTTYQLRVDTVDPNLPAGASPGTAIVRNVTVASGAAITDQDFGFDISNAFLIGDKTVSVYDPLLNGPYLVPGTDVIYTITISNSGDGAADGDSLFLVDTLPDEVIFYNGDMDDAGPLTADPVAFQQSGAGLTFTYGSDVAFAMPGPKPANMSACNYVPAPGYDPSVGYICFAPKGSMATGSPNPNFSVSFRARLN